MALLAHAVILDEHGAQAGQLLEEVSRIREGYGEFSAMANKAIEDALCAVNSLRPFTN